jgi:hypothetical protein
MNYINRNRYFKKPKKGESYEKNKFIIKEFTTFNYQS